MPDQKVFGVKLTRVGKVVFHNTGDVKDVDDASAVFEFLVRHIRGGTYDKVKEMVAFWDSSNIDTTVEGVIEHFREDGLNKIPTRKI